MHPTHQQSDDLVESFEGQEFFGHHCLQTLQDARNRGAQTKTQTPKPRQNLVQISN